MVQPGTIVFATERVPLQWVIARFALVALADGQARGPASGGGPSRKAVAILRSARSAGSQSGTCAWQSRLYQIPARQRSA